MTGETAPDHRDWYQREEGGIYSTDVRAETIQDSGKEEEGEGESALDGLRRDEATVL